MTSRILRFFLGGRDLEMVEISDLLGEAGLTDQICDRRLAWGAAASVYVDAIRASLARDETPVLIELADDLPPDIDRSRLIVVDHHGPLAGLDRPTALEQVHALVGLGAGLPWSRRRALIAANDRGHAAGMRALGATAVEIREIRDADRAAQGVTAEIEWESRRAIGAAEAKDDFLVVTTTAATATAIHDFLLPEYDGPGASEVLVETAMNWGFSGSGRVISDLSSIPGCWYGGALPRHGFWGAPKASIARNALLARVSAALSTTTAIDPTI